MSGHLRLLSIAALGILTQPLALAAQGVPIGWSDLLPASPREAASSAQNSGVAARLAGEMVELSGYLLPADREGELVYAFMLVPERGACSHTPPPPANQVVRVVPEKPYRLNHNFEAVSVSGTLRPGMEKTQIFILDGVATIESGYSISMAEVEPAQEMRGAQRGAGPWRFLDEKGER